MPSKSLENISIDWNKYKTDVKYRISALEALNNQQKVKNAKTAVTRKIPDNITFETSAKQVDESDYNRNKRINEENKRYIKSNAAQKEIGRELVDMIPFVGDALTVADIGNDINKGNYIDAGLGAAMLAFPYIVEKPLKIGAKYIKKMLRNSIKTTVKGIGYGYETLDAIINNRFLPFMSKEQIRNYYRDINEEIAKRTLPAANIRYNTRKNYLSEKYKLEDVPDKINPITVFSTRKNGLKHGLQQYDDGINFSTKRNVVAINGRFNSKALRPKRDIYETASHELDHISQNYLKFEEKLPLQYRYAYDINGGDFIWDNGYRNPIVDYDKTYYGIPTSNLNKPNVEKNDLTGPIETIHSFDDLIKRNKNHTWKSSPGELASEIAAFIDYSTKGNLGKTFSELNNKDKNIIIKKISNRFNLSIDEATKMLNSNPSEYFKYGGRKSLETV